MTIHLWARRIAPRAVIALGLAAGLSAEEKAVTTAVPDAARLATMTARFAPVPIGVDISKLPASERQALAKLVEAARILDPLFLRQVWAGNEAALMTLLGDTTPLGRARLHYFLINKGPWSRLDHNAPFIPGVPPKPEGANFYPAGATKDEVEAWIKSLPEGENKTLALNSVRNAGGGKYARIAAEAGNLLKQKP